MKQQQHSHWHCLHLFLAPPSHHRQLLGESQYSIHQPEGRQKQGRRHYRVKEKTTVKEQLAKRNKRSERTVAWLKAAGMSDTISVAATGDDEAEGEEGADDETDDEKPTEADEELED